MIGSTIPGLTADVMRADIAARLGEAQERQAPVLTVTPPTLLSKRSTRYREVNAAVDSRMGSTASRPGHRVRPHATAGASEVYHAHPEMCPNGT